MSLYIAIVTPLLNLDSFVSFPYPTLFPTFRKEQRNNYFILIRNNYSQIGKCKM